MARKKSAASLVTIEEAIKVLRCDGETDFLEIALSKNVPLCVRVPESAQVYNVGWGYLDWIRSASSEGARAMNARSVPPALPIVESGLAALVLPRSGCEQLLQHGECRCEYYDQGVKLTVNGVVMARPTVPERTRNLPSLYPRPADPIRTFVIAKGEEAGVTPKLRLVSRIIFSKMIVIDNSSLDLLSKEGRHQAPLSQNKRDEKDGSEGGPIVDASERSIDRLPIANGRYSKKLDVVMQAWQDHWKRADLSNDAESLRIHRRVRETLEKKLASGDNACSRSFAEAAAAMIRPRRARTPKDSRKQVQYSGRVTKELDALVQGSNTFWAGVNDQDYENQTPRLQIEAWFEKEFGFTRQWARYAAQIIRPEGIKKGRPKKC